VRAVQQQERLVFEVSFKSVYDWIPEAGKPTVEREWRELGIDVKRLLPGYPVEKWWRAVEAATTVLEGTRRERLRQVGRGLAERFSQTFMGRALAPLARLTGPRRSLVRSPITFRSGNNFVTSLVEVNEEFNVRLRVNDISPICEMFAGSIEGLVLFTGGHAPEVEFVHDGTDTLYTVRWSAAA
jgi:uncharacterized protein (TIGR02265 family)